MEKMITIHLKYIVALALLMISSVGFSQYQNIMISEAGSSVSEPSISMNPKILTNLLRDQT